MKVAVYQDSCPITGRQRTWMKETQMNHLKHLSRMVLPCGSFDCTMQNGNEEGDSCQGCPHAYGRQDVLVEIRDWDGRLEGVILKPRHPSQEDLSLEFVKRKRFSGKGLAMAVLAHLSKQGKPVGEGENPGSQQGTRKVDLRRLKISGTNIQVPEDPKEPITCNLSIALKIARDRTKMVRKETLKLGVEAMERLSAELLGAPHEPGYLAHRAYSPNSWRYCREDSGWDIYHPYEWESMVMYRHDHCPEKGRFFWAYTKVQDLKEVRELTSWGEEIFFYPREGRVRLLMWEDSPSWARVEKYI